MSKFLAAILKPLLTFLAAWLGGRAAAQKAEKIEEYNRYVETSKRIDAVIPEPDPDAAAKWLLDRAKR